MFGDGDNQLSMNRCAVSPFNTAEPDQNLFLSLPRDVPPVRHIRIERSGANQRRRRERVNAK